MNAPALPGTLIGRLRHWARQTPDRIALRDKDRGIWQEITWSEYRDAVRATAHMLRHMGVEPGDHVAILSDNRPEWLYADLGTQAIGARAVGIYQTNPPPDVAYILEHARCRVLFCEDQEQVDKALEIRGQTPTVEAVVVFDDRGTRAYDDDRLLSWETFIAEGRTLAAAEGERVRLSDERQGELAIVRSGRVGVGVPVDDGHHWLELLHAGDVYGELGGAGPARRASELVALAETEVVVLPADLLERLESAEPGLAMTVARNLLRIMAWRVDDLHRRHAFGVRRDRDRLARERTVPPGMHAA